MPFFDENPLDKLALQGADADQTLDLRGLGEDPAMRQLDQLLRDGGDGKTWAIRFDAAANDGRETLFLPIGRRLLEARRAGTLSQCLPISDGSGYLIAFS